MFEAIIIIVALGGLEIVLWYLDYKHQKKVVELLDSIWAELAIHNAVDDDFKPAGHKHAA